MFSKIKHFIFDLVFPKNCIGCGEEGDWICEKCLCSIDIIKEPFCPECRKPTMIGEFCEDCSVRGGQRPLDGIFICANFGDGVLREMIHQFKYNFIFDIGETLGKIVVGKLKHLSTETLKQENKNIPQFDLIIPVPLYKKRKKWRGFNQAEILGRVICRDLIYQIPDEQNPVFNKNILIKKKNTIQQAELNREERLRNLEGVFVVETQNFVSLREKNILLVDDITTTGSTLEECARVLKESGAKNVWGIVLAKGK